ncbi:MAG TPA: response regulator [Gemmatimonadaceae bacterium]|jgi:CheY-like chemotaxis protein|nr:response regulator [Gemmatimonadaceae bacterium]
MGATLESPVLARTAVVVDDEQVVRMVLRRFLGRRGWSVVEAESAEQALDAIAGAGETPDLVLCDLHLPGLSGSALCRRVGELHPALAGRLVLTSGDPLAAANELAQEGLDCPVLGKPFSLADLDALLDTLGAAL